MKRRRLILIGALAAVAAVLLALWPRGPKEPVYEGKRLSEWMDVPYASGHVQKVKEAEKAIQTIGTNGIPYLMHLFQRPISGRKKFINAWLDYTIGGRFQFDTGEGRLQKAFHAFTLLGTNATPWLPELSPLLNDPYRSVHVALAMAACGEPALSYFQQTLASTNLACSYAALSGIGALARHHDFAVPHLLELLNHTNAALNKGAAFTVLSMHEKPEVFMPQQVMLAAHPDPMVRHVLTNVLGRFHPTNAPALSKLVPLLTNPNPLIAITASNAIFRIDPAAWPQGGR